MSRSNAPSADMEREGTPEDGTAAHQRRDAVCLQWKSEIGWMRMLGGAFLALWLGGVAAVYVPPGMALHPVELVKAVLAENHGVMFCRDCDDPLRQGSVVPALASHYNPVNYFVRGELVYAVPNDGSHDLYNDHEVFGRIAVMDRGRVPFALKVRRAQLAGALGVVVINNSNCDLDRRFCEGSPELQEQLATMGLDDQGQRTFLQDDPYSSWSGIGIPSVMVSAADGERIREFMALTTFEVNGLQQYAVDFDGSF